MLALLFACLATHSLATLTSDQKTAILNKHNVLRGTLPAVEGVNSPCTAADMETLVWDDALATAAQTYADQCKGDHDPQLTSMGGSVSHGENLWMQMDSTSYTQQHLLDSGVYGWYSELRDTEWTVTAVNSKAGRTGAACISPDGTDKCFIGHYTQVVWAKSNKLGCGLKVCNSGLTISGTSYSSGVVLVCRYTPMGNSACQPGTCGNVGIRYPFMYGSTGAACAGSHTNGLCNTGATINRCVDGPPPYALNGQNHNTCAALVTAINAMSAGMDACTTAALRPMVEGSCDKHCNLCTTPSGIEGVCASSTGAKASTSGAPSLMGIGAITGVAMAVVASVWSNLF